MEVSEKLRPPPSQFSLRTVTYKDTYADLSHDVFEGLSACPKTLAPKYFYDAHGSRLFDQICDTKEYYPTRIEDALLASSAMKIMESARPAHIIELGSGVSKKTRHLLDACEHLNLSIDYHPVDICGEIIEQAGLHLSKTYEWLNIKGVVADYCEDMTTLPDHDEPRLFVFLGGTFGNFHEHEAKQFLEQLKSIMRPDDRFLLGFDRIKDHDVLNLAYNDCAGLTASFNRNVLAVINRELSANFDLGAFEHDAWFNEKESRIEMHLRSTKLQKVFIDSIKLDVEFAEGETILTEISRKFTPDHIETLLQKSGMKVTDHFQPASNYFSLVMAQPEPVHL